MTLVVIVVIKFIHNFHGFIDVVILGRSIAIIRRMSSTQTFISWRTLLTLWHSLGSGTGDFCISIQTWSEFLSFDLGIFFNCDAFSWWIEIYIYLWQSHSQNNTHQFISLHSEVFVVTLGLGISEFNEWLQPFVKLLGLNNLIIPEVDNALVILIKVDLLGWSFNSQIEHILFEEPHVLFKGLFDLIDFTQLDNVIRLMRELIDAVIGNKDTFNRIDVYVSRITT